MRRFADIDGDDVEDFLVGSEFPNAPGIVRAISGVDGSEIYRVTGDLTADLFGADIAVLSDVNNDGTPDYAVGAPYYITNPGTGQGENSYVRIISGIDGQKLMKITSPSLQSDDWFGFSLAAMRSSAFPKRLNLVVGAPGESHGILWSAWACIYLRHSPYDSFLRIPTHWYVRRLPLVLRCADTRGYFALQLLV